MISASILFPADLVLICDYRIAVALHCGALGITDENSVLTTQWYEARDKISLLLMRNTIYSGQ